MSLIRWNPYREIGGLQRDLNKVFNSFWGDYDDANQNANITISPKANVLEEKDKYVIDLELPGLEKKDIKISAKNGILEISAERNNEKKIKKESYVIYESSQGSFKRSFTLPDGTEPDKINANMKNGILTIDVPKAEKHKAKEIEIKVS